MGTRSLIGIKTWAGMEHSPVKKTPEEIVYIYCHWDGYPSHNGKILLDHYKDEDKVLELMDLGDLSSLGPEIGEKQDFNKPHDGWCLSYGRDRGESKVEAGVVDSEQEFKSLGHGSEFKYLFKDGKWHFTSGKHGFVELTQEACKE